MNKLEYRKELKSKFLATVKNKKFGYLYVIELRSETERFIKVGITTTSIRNRFKKNPYKYKVLLVKKHLNLHNLFDKETYLLNKFEEVRHQPSILFSGSTECFDIASTKAVIKEAKRSWKKIKKDGISEWKADELCASKEQEDKKT